MTNPKVSIKAGWDKRTQAFYLIEDHKAGSVDVLVEQGSRKHKTQTNTLKQAEKWISRIVNREFVI